MINITHRSKLEGIEKNGCCASCGKEIDVYKLYFEDNHRNYASISLCFDCLSQLGNMIYDIYNEETDKI